MFLKTLADSVDCIARLYAANAIRRRARNALIEVVQWPTIVPQAKPTDDTRDVLLAVIIYGPLSILA